MDNANWQDEVRPSTAVPAPAVGRRRQDAASSSSSSGDHGRYAPVNPSPLNYSVSASGSSDYTPHRSEPEREAIRQDRVDQLVNQDRADPNHNMNGFLEFVEHLVRDLLTALKALIPVLWIQSKTAPIPIFIAAVVLLLTYFALGWVLPAHESAEPPFYIAKVPVVGHLWGLVRNQVNYLDKVYKETRAPIVALPIGLRKIYVIYDAALQQAALKSKDMDAQSFMVDFVPRIFGVKQGTVDKLLGKDGVHPSIMDDMEAVFKSSLSCDNLIRLAKNTLDDVALELNAIDKERGLGVPNLFFWVQNLITKATSKALWGERHNPYNDQRIIDAQWEFEDNMGPLVLGYFPSIIARKAYLARSKISDALEAYFRARHDQTAASVSEFVRARARLLRDYDIPDDELAKNEVVLTLVATTNALSTLFWCIAEIYIRPDLLEAVRKEVYEAVFGVGSPSPQIPPREGRARNLIIESFGLETKCPLLTSCYRESIRLASQIVTARRVIKDTVISAPSTDGTVRAYLLKADTNVLMPAKVLHRNPAVWGADAEYFNACRFLPPSEDSPATRQREREIKASFVPFGGGKHMCPGRQFAFKENLAILSALVLGFDMDGLDKNKLVMGESKRGETAKPMPGWEGGDVVVKRRKGWENVVWGFTC